MNFDALAYNKEKQRLKAIREDATTVLINLEAKPSTPRQELDIARKALREARNALNTFISLHCAARPDRFKFSFIAADGSGRTATIFAGERGIAEMKARAVIDKHSIGRPPVRDLHLVKMEKA